MLLSFYIILRDNSTKVIGLSPLNMLYALLYAIITRNETLPKKVLLIPFLQIQFVENKHIKSTMLEDIDESQLPDVYGGKLPLIPVQDA